MLAKLVVLIVSVASLSASMLVVRQQRLEAVGEMADTLRRSERADRELWRLRVDIAERLSPEELNEAIRATLGPMEPILIDDCERWCPPGLGDTLEANAR